MADGPYIVTVRWQGAAHPKPSTPEHPNPVAVATLEEARDKAVEIVREHRHLWPEHAFLPEFGPLIDAAGLLAEGGSVGPLPDGTVIEVRPVDLIDLDPDFALRRRIGSSIEADLIAAFNEAEGESDA